jgi:group I intron endonuclease
MRKIGIYEFRNKVSGKSYIGSTKDHKERYWSHISKLKRNVHDNKELQKDFNLLGRDNFEMIMLEECTIDMLLEREQFWSDKIENKYNVRANVVNNIGVGHSDEVKLLLSKNKMGSKNPFYGKKHSDESNQKRKMFRGELSKRSKLVLDTKTGIFYSCAREAGEAYQIKNSYMIGMLNGTNKNKTNLRYA